MQSARNFFGIVVLSALTISCQKTSCGPDVDEPQLIDSGGVPIPPCDSLTMCTMDFRMITVRTLRSDSSAAPLDSFHVTNAAGVPLPPLNGQPLYGPLLSNPQLPPDGRYAVLTDAWLAGHQQTQTTVYAKGWRNGALLFNQAFGVGADCCHVYKDAGPDIIIVQ